MSALYDCMTPAYFEFWGKRQLLMKLVDTAVGEPTAPLKDPAPHADEQTRNQNVEDATNDPQAPKVKSEKECTYQGVSAYVDCQDIC